MEIKKLYQLFLASSGISTDTRKIEPGNIFFALRGDNFNGNKFAQNALDAGAAYAVVDEKEYKRGDTTLVVEDVLKTLQELATFHRNHLNIPIISLTGSNGKTTTKELIHTVLSKKFKTVATKGNLNNHIGVPLTLLSMSQDTELGIVEMGANHQGEIKMLSEIAQPDYGYITNFGKAHLEGFGGEEGVIKGKSELYDYLRSAKGIVILNTDDAKQLRQAKGITSYRFGTTANTDLRITYKGATPFAKLEVEGESINSQLMGTYNSTNIAAAISFGRYFDISIGAIKEAIENYVPSNNRSQLISQDGMTILLDAYNANPTSMEAAILNFSSWEAKTKMAFLGDMFELGETATIEHQRIVDLAVSKGFDHIVLLGENFMKTESLETVYRFKNFHALQKEGFPEAIKNNLPESHILIKGSRGMALERILNLLK